MSSNLSHDSHPIGARVGSPAYPYLRWLSLLWMIVWVPAYWQVWGWRNFLHICDVSVILTCVGLWFGNSLLLSSQTLATMLPDTAWCLDAGWRLIFGHHLFGGTEYLWDSNFPVWVRLLSLFHVFLPLILVWSCMRVGYDRRALKLQMMITAALLGVSRLLGGAVNINYTYRDPVFHKALGPAPVHMVIILTGMFLMYWPVHIILSRTISERGRWSVD